MWNRDFGWFVLICCVVVGVLLVGNSHWVKHVTPDFSADSPNGPDYSHAPASWAGRAACFECHADADSAWTGSDHDLAMQTPGPKTVTANFNDATFTHFGVTSTFYMSGHRYMVRTDGPDGKMTDFEVAYVFGYFPLEQFLIRFPDGRLQALNICWDSTAAEDGGQRWFHLYPTDETPANDLFHWTGMLQNWNFMCAECHSTNLQRKFDLEQNSYATTWSEIDVSCEACHGPGSRHILWERAFAQGLNPRNKSASRGLLVNLKSPDKGFWFFEQDKTIATRSEPLASRVEVESCARCHSRRSQLTADYEYGRSFFDHNRLTLLDEFLYHADGQNQDEVYVYGSFLQSKMYTAGVTCSDCHDYHTTRTKGSGNQVCARCHLAQVYDSPDHHFHQKGKGGDSCLDCHMQSRNLMVVDGRRDHSFRIPRPDLTLELGTPNACSDCHDDKSVQWSQDAIVKWYGDGRLQGPHYAVALFAGRTGEPGALERLRFLVGAPDQPDIAKATALSLMSRFAGTSEIPEVVQALTHDNPLVRGAAVRSLVSSHPERQLSLAGPLMQDEIRDVRQAAAQLIAGLSLPEADNAQNPLITQANFLWEQALRSNEERPESQLGLAAMYINRGERSSAEKCFRTALALEPRFNTSYVNYADFLRRDQRHQEAEDILRQGVVAIHDSADIKHSLGLLLVSMGDLPGALVFLEEAVVQRENIARYAYVYAVALHDAGKVEQSLRVLEESLARNSWDWDSLLACALYAMQLNEPSRAVGPVDKLVQLNPNDSRIINLQMEIHAKFNNSR